MSNSIKNVGKVLYGIFMGITLDVDCFVPAARIAAVRR